MSAKYNPKYDYSKGFNQDAPPAELEEITQDEREKALTSIDRLIETTRAQIEEEQEGTNEAE